MVGSLFMYLILCTLLLLLWSYRMYANACEDFSQRHTVSAYIQLAGSLLLMGVGIVLPVLALMAKAQVTPGEFSP